MPAEYHIPIPEQQEQVERFFEIFSDFVNEEKDLPIALIFALLPIRPTKVTKKRRLMHRGSIKIQGNNLSNEDVDQQGYPRRAIRAYFEDDNIGKIKITFKALLTASTTITANSVKIDFSQNMIPIKLYKNIPGIDSNLELFEIFFTKGESVRNSFQERDNPSRKLNIFAHFNETTFTNLLPNAVQLFSSLKNRDQNRITAFTLMAASEGCCFCSGGLDEPVPDDGEPTTNFFWACHYIDRPGNQCVVSNEDLSVPGTLRCFRFETKEEAEADCTYIYI